MSTRLRPAAAAALFGAALGSAAPRRYHGRVGAVTARARDAIRYAPAAPTPRSLSPTRSAD